MKYYIPKSSLGWIDFSESDRQKVLKVIDLMNGENMVDELGIGIIRNALSDAMFPGITTIMTRAKYFFIVPRILYSFLMDKTVKVKAKEYLSKKENDIMENLSRFYNYEEKKGVIGITVAKRNATLQLKNRQELVRKPSAIYWTGISSYEIYTGEFSLVNFLEDLDKKKKSNQNYIYKNKEGESGEDRDTVEIQTSISLPDYNLKWEDALTLDLTPGEADTLKQKIIDQFGSSLLAKVLQDQNAIKDFLSARSFDEMTRMPFVNFLPKENQEIIKTSRGFWQILKGAHIRFNILLHKSHGSPSYLQEVEGKWNEWLREMDEFNWEEFDEDLLWDITNVKSVIKESTKIFIKQWTELVRTRQLKTEDLDALIKDQERNIKKYRAKLREENDDKYDGWTGISELNYRFNNAKTIIQDIYYAGL